MIKTSVSLTQILKATLLTIVFLLLAVLLYFAFRENDALSYTTQKMAFGCGLSAILSFLATIWLSMQLSDSPAGSMKKKVWFYPVVSGVLALCCMTLAYIFLGVWPIGQKTVMIVDMHHQYAPLLAELRDMLIHGGSPLYSFEVGMGTSFLPLFGYYLSSPFNILLIFFPENLLPEGILVITLLKNAFAAAFFATCIQYVYHRRTIAIPVVSIMYSLMMYMLAYSWNIMWLDCVMMLPLVVMYFERLMRTGKYLGYVLSLAYALYANYYIGFMLCIFLLIYYMTFALRQPRTMKNQAYSFLRFTLGSALGGGLVMFLLIPVYLALGHTSAAGGGLPELASNFDIFKLLGRHLYETSPTIRTGNLPNIYCGVLAVFLLPIFATTKTITLRRRISYMAMLLVLAMCMVLNQADLLFHGLHAPNDLPYRFSFLYSFVLLLITYETLLHLKDLAFRQIATSFIGIVAYLVLEEHFGDESYKFDTIYISMLLILIYAIISALAARKKMAVRAAYMLLLLVVVAEMTLNAGATFKALNSNEYFTSHNDYVDNDTTKVIEKTIAKAEAIGNNEANGEFYRLELLPRRTCVDTALFDYRGITTFASSNSYDTTKFMGNIGYAINGVNSYLYHSFVAPIDSLLGIRYVVLNSNISSHPQLEKVGSAEEKSENYYIYKNKYALPVGYFVQSEIKDWESSYYNPFMTQNNLFSSMTGNDNDIYNFQSVHVQSGSEDIAGINGTYNVSVNPKDNSKVANFDVSIEKKGQAFIYVDCRAADSISVTQQSDSWSVTTHEPYIIDAGTLDAGDIVSVSITSDSACTGNIYVVTMNNDVFEQNMQTLSANGIKVSSFTDSSITGSVTAPTDGVIFTSIPYDAGWQVTVDGKRVETFSACDAMVAFDVKSGDHTVKITFFPEGLMVGLIISGASLLLLIVLLYITRKPVSAIKNKSPASYRALTENGFSNERMPTNEHPIVVVSVEEDKMRPVLETTGEVPSPAALDEQEPLEPNSEDSNPST